MDIYPVHLLDDATSYRNLFLSYVLTFNDVLDPQKLADSLSELLRNGDWRKLRGRFQLNNAKRLEIHVPQLFSKDYPAITFSRGTVDKGIDSHPLGTWLRSPENHCTAQQSTDDLRDFAGIPSTPQSMEEMMNRDAPLLSLHVTSFADATVVAISWPHVLMDAMGLQALLRNWSLVLNNKADEVPPLIGNHYDPLRTILKQDTGEREDLLIEKHSFGLVGSLVLLFRVLWMSLWKPVFEMRTIILPQDVLDRFCSQARAEGTTKGDQTTFISEGDILNGWAAKMLAASQSTPRPITVASIVNLRFRLNAVQEQKGEHVNNLLQFVYAFFTTDCATEPLGVTALGYRQQLAAQSTKGQILSYIDMQRRHVEAKGALKMLYGDPRAEMLTTNNLSKLDFFRNIDFSAAVVQRGDLSSWGIPRQNPPGTLLYYHPLELTKSFQTSHLRVLGKDYAGRTLLTGIFPPKTWELIRKELETL